MTYNRLFQSVVALLSIFDSMAWRSHGQTNIDLIRNLKRNGIIKSERVERAMTAVDRGNFCKNNAYQDRPQSIGFAVTISAPHMHAYALELLKDHLYEGQVSLFSSHFKRNNPSFFKNNSTQNCVSNIEFILITNCVRAKALDVGSGSGYLTACMAVMVGPKGKAVGIDHIPELVNFSIENIEKDKPGLIKSGNIKMIVGDGRLGYPPEAEYDAIHVGAASPQLPTALIQQLKVGGRLIIPMGKEGYNQNLEQVDKLADGTIRREPLMGVVYVPLTDREAQWPGR